MYDTAFPVGRLVRQLADKSQMGTQRYSKRPFGIGLLIAGYDSTGPHLFQTCPSANFYEYHAIAIGARSQARLGTSSLPPRFTGIALLGL